MHPAPDAGPLRRVEPLSTDWRSFPCAGGIFDMARRAPTPRVEGVIRTPHAMILVTLQGGAERLTVASDCGHHHDGPDRAGSVSFVPAQCERRLTMSGVRSHWASLSLPSTLLDQSRLSVGAFTNQEDPFLAGLVREMARLADTDGGFDPLYAEAMTGAAAHYLMRRHGKLATQATPGKLAAWQRRRVETLIEDRLAGEIRIADLAAEARLSPAHFHRAWRQTTGETPLASINAARIRRALAIMAAENCPVAELAIRVGFVSPGYFARLFRAAVGRSPSALRRG